MFYIDIMPWELKQPHPGIIFACVLIGSSAFRHSKVQGLVLDYVGEGKPDQFKKDVGDCFGEECEVRVF